MHPKLLALAVATCFALGPQAAEANPTGPTVVSGSASFAAAGNLLTVTNGANAIINWRGFSIGANEITRFMQPSAASAVLNRVIGSGGVVPQSVIDGVLSSNGRVFLLNPSGIVIGAGARIDVAGLIASSLNLSNEDFLAGRLRFAEVPGAGGVANHGVIETPSGGRVFLVAPDVQNSGIIRAPQGEIVLAAGKSAELVSESSPYVTVNVVADAERALNVGQLVAQSGRIGMYGALLRNSGVAEAGGAVADAGGQIRFVAAKDLTLDAGSRVAANGTTGGSIVLQAQGGANTVAGTVEAIGNSGAGGSVQALGQRVGLTGSGVIDASGETGGGTVLVGGDFQGRNPAIQNADRTLIGADGVIRADAGATGDGGRVIVWADGDTRFYGSISARGGSLSGNGGFVEVSGKQKLAFFGHVDAGAPQGRAGRLLLDPADYVLCNGSATGGSCTTNEATLEAAAASSFVFVDGTNSVTINDLADNELFLANGGQFTAGAGGIVMQDTNDTIRSAGAILDFYSGGAVTLGHLDTSFGVSPASPSSQHTSIVIDASGAVTTGNIVTGSSNYGDTMIEIFAGGPINVGNLSTGLSYGLDGGGYSGVILMSEGAGVYAGSIATGAAAYDSSVYVGANSVDTIVVGNIATGTADYASAVYLYDPIGAISAGNITTGGGTNPFAASDAQVFISAGAGVATGNISVATANEGDGVGIMTSAGNITTGSIVTRGANPGADAGDVYLSAPAGSVTVNGIIDTRGTDDPSGIGGDGGSVSIMALNTVVVGPPPTFGTNTTVIDTSGGAGYMGGGHAGSVFVDPVAITFNGVILALGGAGGFGPGGDGGNLDLITSNGTVTFVNGGWDLTGGAGNGPGSNGSVNIVGTLIFAFLNDPLANSAVSQSIGQTIDELTKVLDQTADQDTTLEDEKNKKPLASCRPG